MFNKLLMLLAPFLRRWNYTRTAEQASLFSAFSTWLFILASTTLHVKCTACMCHVIT